MKMSEIFDLPIPPDGLYEIFVHYGTTMEEDEAIANCINHADALADALDDLMEWHVKNVNVIHHPVYDLAHKALAAYRGAK